MTISVCLVGSCHILIFVYSPAVAQASGYQAFQSFVVSNKFSIMLIRLTRVIDISMC